MNEAIQVVQTQGDIKLLHKENLEKTKNLRTLVLQTWKGEWGNEFTIREEQVTLS